MFNQNNQLFMKVKGQAVDIFRLGLFYGSNDFQFDFIGMGQDCDATFLF